MKKRIFGVALVHLAVIGGLFIGYFEITIMEMKMRLLRSHQGIIEPQLWYLNMFLFVGFVIIIEIGLSYFLAKRFLRSLKEVVLVGALILVTLSAWPVVTMVQGIGRFVECERVLSQRWQMGAKGDSKNGKCLTFRENSKVFAVYPGLFIVLGAISGAGAYSGVIGQCLRNSSEAI